MSTHNEAFKLAQKLHAELALSTSAEQQKGIIKKWYADNVEQNEAGEPVRKSILHPHFNIDSFYSLGDKGTGGSTCQRELRI